MVYGMAWFLFVAGRNSTIVCGVFFCFFGSTTIVCLNHYTFPHTYSHYHSLILTNFLFQKICLKNLPLFCLKKHTTVSFGLFGYYCLVARHVFFFNLVLGMLFKMGYKKEGSNVFMGHGVKLKKQDAS